MAGNRGREASRRADNAGGRRRQAGTDTVVSALRLCGGGGMRGNACERARRGRRRPVRRCPRTSAQPRQLPQSYQRRGRAAHGSRREDRRTAPPTCSRESLSESHPAAAVLPWRRSCWGWQCRPLAANHLSREHAGAQTPGLRAERDRRTLRSPCGRGTRQGRGAAATGTVATQQRESTARARRRRRSLRSLRFLRNARLCALSSASAGRASPAKRCARTPPSPTTPPPRPPPPPPRRGGAACMHAAAGAAPAAAPQATPRRTASRHAHSTSARSRRSAGPLGCAAAMGCALLALGSPGQVSYETCGQSCPRVVRAAP